MRVEDVALYLLKNGRPVSDVALAAKDPTAGDADISAFVMSEGLRVEPIAHPEPVVVSPAILEALANRTSIPQLLEGIATIYVLQVQRPGKVGGFEMQRYFAVAREHSQAVEAVQEGGRIDDGDAVTINHYRTSFYVTAAAQERLSQAYAGLQRRSGQEDRG